MTAIGFIGLGKMGAPMAVRLCAAGHHLTVLDASADAIATFLAANQATAAKTARDLAAGSDIVVTMLPTSAIVAQVLLGADGVLAGLRPSALVIEMSSGVPATTQVLAADVARAGGVLIDAPVSGGVARALSGELAIMVGGPADAVARAVPMPVSRPSTATASRSLSASASAAPTAMPGPEPRPAPPSWPR